MLPYLITYFCLSFDPQYNQACNQGLNVASIQIHLRQDLDFYQEKIQKNIETEVTEKTGRKVWIAGMIYYQMMVKESLNFSAPIKPFADSISGTINRQQQLVTLTWIF